MVGMAGFEPATPRPPVWCASQAALRPDALIVRYAERLRRGVARGDAAWPRVFCTRPRDAALAGGAGRGVS